MRAVRNAVSYSDVRAQIEPLPGLFEPAFDQLADAFEECGGLARRNTVKADIKDDHVQNGDQSCGIRKYSNHFKLCSGNTVLHSLREATKVMKNNIRLMDCQQLVGAPSRAEFKRGQTRVAKILQETVPVNVFGFDDARHSVAKFDFVVADGVAAEKVDAGIVEHGHSTTL